METEKVEALIRAGIPDAQVTVTGDGRHFEALVVSAEFEGLALIKRHRLVLDTVTAKTPAEVG